ncbi:hypothetical protein ACI65C_002467, partial [Semiaphis heraclei]
MSTSSEGLSTCSDGDDRNKLIDMITQTVTSVCDVAAISVGGRPRTARGLCRRKDDDGEEGVMLQARGYGYSVDRCTVSATRRNGNGIEWESRAEDNSSAVVSLGVPTKKFYFKNVSFTYVFFPRYETQGNAMDSFDHLARTHSYHGKVKIEDQYSKILTNQWTKEIEDDLATYVGAGSKVKDMTAVNTGLPGIRVPLKSSYASALPQQTAVFMYSTAGPDGQTVTLQLRETDETIELPASMLSKMSRQTDTATLSISYQDSAEVLTDGTIDLLLATTPLHSSGDGQSTHSPGFELFDSDNGHDLTLSPQTFTANTTAESFLVNDNSNSIGMPVNETDT